MVNKTSYKQAWVCQDEESRKEHSARAFKILSGRGRMHMNDLARLMRCSAGRAYYACDGHEKIELDDCSGSFVFSGPELDHFKFHNCFGEIK